MTPEAFSDTIACRLHGKIAREEVGGKTTQPGMFWIQQYSKPGQRAPNNQIQEIFLPLMILS